MEIQTSLSESASAEIRAELGRQNRTYSDLAKACGWIPMYLQRRITGRVPWTLDELAKVAHELGIPAHHLLEPVQR